MLFGQRQQTAAGCARTVGVRPAAWNSRDRAVPSAASPLRGVPGHARVVAGHGPAAAGGCRWVDPGRVAGSGGWPGHRRIGLLLGLSSSTVRGVVAADGVTTGAGAGAVLLMARFAGGDLAQSPRLAVAGHGRFGESGVIPSSWDGPSPALLRSVEVGEPLLDSAPPSLWAPFTAESKPC
jgi:hypothetical protein